MWVPNSGDQLVSAHISLISSTSFGKATDAAFFVRI